MTDRITAKDFTTEQIRDTILEVLADAVTDIPKAQAAPRDKHGSISEPDGRRNSWLTDRLSNGGWLDNMDLYFAVWERLVPPDEDGRRPAAERNVEAKIKRIARDLGHAGRIAYVPGSESAPFPDGTRRQANYGSPWWSTPEWAEQAERECEALRSHDRREVDRMSMAQDILDRSLEPYGIVAEAVTRRHRWEGSYGDQHPTDKVIIAREDLQRLVVMLTEAKMDQVDV